ncbi:MAG: FAD-dependent oxidoreductase [Bacteroidetes bacterium]|nr:MAG: FAD-dependent oxidoreductase [Bacteroidota bacterium]
MNKTFDTIIWGPSLEGIKKAIELKQEGKEVLLAGKFGFPGGKATESLSCLFSAGYFNDEGILARFLKLVEGLKYGILYRNAQWILMHPEAVKRVCWQLLEENNVELLFHVIPLKLHQGNPMRVDVFGREGKFTLEAGLILDLSDDRNLDNLKRETRNRDIFINSFFHDPLPAHFPGFRIIRSIQTPIGQYVSISQKNVPSNEIESTFNRELDRLSKESWKKHQARILMVPVYPEVK